MGWVVQGCPRKYLIYLFQGEYVGSNPSGDASQVAPFIALYSPWLFGMAFAVLMTAKYFISRVTECTNCVRYLTKCENHGAAQQSGLATWQRAVATIRQVCRMVPDQRDCSPLAYTSRRRDLAHHGSPGRRGRATSIAGRVSLRSHTRGGGAASLRVLYERALKPGWRRIGGGGGDGDGASHVRSKSRT